MSDLSSSDDAINKAPETTDSQEATYPGVALTNINDYCLLHIFQYLKLHDACNVAFTCKRLNEFVSDFIFDKHAKHFQLKMICPGYTKIPEKSYVVTLKQLRAHFIQIHPFVEQISFTLTTVPHMRTINNKMSFWSLYAKLSELANASYK